MDKVCKQSVEPPSLGVLPSLKVGVQITDFTLDVQDETPQFLVINLSFRIAPKEMGKKAFSCLF